MIEKKIGFEQIYDKVELFLKKKVVKMWEINLKIKKPHDIDGYIFEVVCLINMASEGYDLTGNLLEKAFIKMMMEYTRPEGWENHFPPSEWYRDSVMKVLEENENIKRQE